MEHSAWISRGREVARHANQTRTLGLAAESAFWLFLSLVPLAAVAGLVAARTTTNNWQALAPVIGSLPFGTRELVTTELFEMSRWNGGTVGLTGAIAFVWLASSGVQALFEGLEIETRSARSWGRRRVLALLTCVGLSFAVALVALLLSSLSGVLFWLGTRVPTFDYLLRLPMMGHFQGFCASGLVTFGHVCGLYWVGVPSATRRRIPMIPGAIVAVLLEFAMTSGYGFYLHRIVEGTAYTAGIAIVGLTLMLLYLLSVSVLFGAVVNHVLGVRSR